MYEFLGNDCLIRDCVGIHGRHNFSFKGMCASGNVIYHCLCKDGLLPSDFHQHLSVANLIDNLVIDNDAFWAVYRCNSFDTPLHGHPTSQSVFWNTYGQKYMSACSVEPNSYNDDETTNDGTGPGLQQIIMTDQFEYGYIIGTRGPCGDAMNIPNTNPSNTKPDDYIEQDLLNKGDQLEPQSLYEAQLKRRLTTPAQ